MSHLLTAFPSPKPDWQDLSALIDAVSRVNLGKAPRPQYRSILSEDCPFFFWQEQGQVLYLFTRMNCDILTPNLYQSIVNSNASFELKAEYCPTTPFYARLMFSHIRQGYLRQRKEQCGDHDIPQKDSVPKYLPIGIKVCYRDIWIISAMLRAVNGNKRYIFKIFNSTH